MNRLSKVFDHLELSQSDVYNNPCNNKKNLNVNKKPIYNPKSNNSNNKSKYRYTLDDFSDKLLTKEQRDFYEENGYLVIKKLLNDNECKYFWNRFDELVTKPELRPPSMTVMRDIATKDEATNKRDSEEKVVKIQDWSREEGLWKYCTNEKILKYVKSICGNNIRAMHFMLINKPPDAGLLSSRHPFHQDQWYFPFSPSDHIVCSWTALMKINRFNGCLSVVPGSHKNSPGGKLLQHGYPQQWHGPVNKAYHGVLGQDINPILRKRVHLEMEAGDTVFFHPLLLHSSGANLSKLSRRSISVHFASSTLCSYCDFEHNAQKLIAEEVEGIAKSKYGQDIPFEMIWRGKSRQVQGEVADFGLNGE